MMTKKETLDRIVQLKALADEADRKADEYEELKKAQLDLWRKYMNEAGALIVPFSVGDVIEYSEHQGWRDGGQVKRMRMRVTRFHLYNTGVEVYGRQVNKQGKESYATKSFLITDTKNPFLSIVKKADKPLDATPEQKG